MKSLLNPFLNGTILDHLRYTLNILGILINRGKLLESLHKLAHNFIHMPPVVKFAHWRYMFANTCAQIRVNHEDSNDEEERFESYQKRLKRRVWRRLLPGKDPV